jgi:hypothetical protein
MSDQQFKKVMREEETSGGNNKTLRMKERDRESAGITGVFLVACTDLWEMDDSFSWDVITWKLIF